MKIIPCKALDIIQHKDFSVLRDEYIEECANSGLPKPQEKLELYSRLDDSGCMFGFCAIENDVLYGFIFLMCAELPHYGRLMATTESLFVGKEYRKTGAGLALIKQAEQCAIELGSPALIISAPIGGSLEMLLPRIGYMATNTAFTKTLGE